MAYNKGLTQQDKDRINQQMREMLTQGKSKEEAIAWRDAQVEAAKANVPANQTDAPQGSVNTVSASGSGSSGSQSTESLEQFANRAGKKRDRVDEDGEVINLAKDFGELGALVESIPFFGDLVDDMYGAVKTGYAQGGTVDDALKLFAGGEDTDPETIQKYIEAVKNLEGQPSSKEMDDFNNIYEESGGGAWGFIKAIAQNPSVAATTAVSSLVAMLNPASAAGAGAGAGVGAAGGAAFAGVGAGVGALAGTFAGAGGVLETGMSFTEFLQEELAEKGLEFDEKGIAAVLSDEDALLRIRGKSAARGGVIAVIDGLTGGLAGKAAKGVANTAKVAGKLKGTLAATAIEGVGGGIGEATARAVVGQEMDAREIGLEIVGEFGTGIALGRAAIATQPEYKIGNQRVNKATIEATLDSDPELAADIEVKNDKELKAKVNESLSGNDKVNENVDVLTTDEREIRDSKTKEIGDIIRQRNEFEKKSPEWTALDQIVKNKRSEFKETVKDQNFKYNNLSTEQKDIIINTQSQIDNNNETISKLQAAQKDNPTTVRDNLIDNLKELNEGLAQEQGQVRAQVEQESQVRAAKNEQAKAKREEAKVEEEITPEQQEAQAEQDAIAQQQADIQEQIQAEVDEEVTDNTQKFDKLTDSMLELGIDIVPVEGTVPQEKAADFIPFTKEGEALAAGDFEKTVQFDPDIPLEKVDAKKAVKEIQTTAKQLGGKADVKVVKVGPEGWGVQGTITSGKRPESLAVKYAQEQEAQPTGEEYAPDQSAFTAEQAEVKSTERAQGIAQEAGFKGNVVNTPEGIQFEGITEGSATSDKRALHKTVNSLKKRGYPEAYADVAAGTVVKGTYQPDTATDEFSIGKDGKARNINTGRFAAKSEGVLRQQQQASSLSGVHQSKKKQKYRKRKHKGRQDEFSLSSKERLKNDALNNVKSAMRGVLSANQFKDALGILESEDINTSNLNLLASRARNLKKTDNYGDTPGASDFYRALDEAIDSTAANRQDEFSLDENRNYNDDQIDDLVFKNAEFVEDNNISQEDYAEVLGPEATEADVAEFSKRMNDQLGREQEGPSQEDIQYELDLLAAPGQTIDQAIEEGITDAQELYDNDDLVFEKANNLYPSDRETGDYNVEGHDNFLNEIQKIIDKKLGKEGPSESAYDRLPETLQLNIDDDVQQMLETYPDGGAANQYFAHMAEGVFETNDESIDIDEWYDDVREAIEDKYNEALGQDEFSLSKDDQFDDAEYQFHQSLNGVPGKVVELNIGLENNPLGYNDIINKLNSIPGLTLSITEPNMGEYEGNPERTLIVKGKFQGDQAAFDSEVKKITDESTQEAIPYTYGGEGKLVWGTGQDAKYGFDPQYFLNAKKPTQAQQRSGANSAAQAAKKLGIDPSAFNEQLQEGESYIIEPQHAVSTTQVTGEALKKVSVGGKGGFAAGTSGDVRNKKKEVQAEGRLFVGTKTAQAAKQFNDELGSVIRGLRWSPEMEQKLKGSPLSKTEGGAQLPLAQIMEYRSKRSESYTDFAYQNNLTPSDGIKAMQSLHAQGLIEDSVMDSANKRYDNLVGYEGAHKNLSKKVIVQKVPTLNLTTKKKPTPSASKYKNVPSYNREKIGVQTPGRKLPGGKFQAGRPRSIMDDLTPDRELRLLGGKERVGFPKERATGERPQIGFPQVPGPGTITDPQVQAIEDAIKGLQEVGGMNAEIKALRDKIKSLKAAPKRQSLRSRIGQQPSIDQNLLDQYNDNKLSDNDLIKALTNYVVSQVPKITNIAADAARGETSRTNVDLEGFAVERLVDQVKKGNFKNKSVSQVFAKAKSIGKSAKSLQRQAHGESKRTQSDINLARRAEQRFEAENGYAPGLDELSDYIKEAFGKDVSPETIEAGRRKDLPMETGSKVEGEARDRAQTRIAREAGLDQLTNSVLTDSQRERVDNAVSKILGEAPVKPSKGKFTGQAPKRGAGFDVKGDKTAAEVKKTNTRLDKFINEGIGEMLTSGVLRDSFRELAGVFGYPEGTTFDSLSKNEKRDLKRKVAKGLAAEAETRLGQDEFSFDNVNDNPDFVQMRAVNLKVSNPIPDIRKAIRNYKNDLNDGKAVTFSVGKSPERKAHIDSYLSGTPFKMVPHPASSGEGVLVKKDVDVNKIATVRTNKDGRALESDGRDFTSRKPTGRFPHVKYNGFNLGRFKSYLDSTASRILPNSYSVVERVDQMPESDVNSIIAELENRFENVSAENYTDNAGLDRVRVIYGNPKEAAAKPESKKDFVTRATDHLKSLFSDIPFITRPRELRAIASRNNIPVRKIKGAYTRDGKVVLNMDNITPDTPFHEVGHAYLKDFAKNYPEIYEKAKQLAKKSSTYQRLKNDPDYGKYEESRLLEEVMATDIGHKGAEIFKTKTDATRWDNFVKKAKQFVAKKLGLGIDAFENMTYGDFIEGAAAQITTLGADANISDDVILEGIDELSIDQQADIDNDISELKAKGVEDNKKWYKPKSWISKIVPPAADDYHGLISKITSIPKKALDSVTKAFVDADHAYKDASTDVRKKVADFQKGLGKKLGDNFGTIAGQKVNYAQAIQAIAKGFEGSNRIKSSEKAALRRLAADPKVKKYVDGMTALGVLKPDGNITNANPHYDLVQYITNDLYKKHFEGFVAKKKEVFSPDVMEAIKETQGEKFHAALENSLQRMSSGKTGSQATTKVGQKWHDFLQGSVGVTMFFNFRSAALQMLSVGNYALGSANPLQTLSKIATGFTDPAMKKRFKQLWNSGYLKERRARAGFDVNATEMLLEAQKGNLAAFQKKLLNKGFAATSAVDSFAIAWGGAAFIESQVKNGVSEKEAIKAWKEQTEEAQQSSRPDRVSQYQTEGVSKFILAFANTPAQYFRLSQKALREIKKGKDVKSNITKLAYYSMIQNAVFTMAQSASTALLYGLSGDDEQDKEALSAYNSMIGSYLRGMGLVGASFDAAKNVIMEAVRQEGKANPDHVSTALKAISISPPLNRKIQDLIAIGRAHNYKADDKWETTVARTGSFANLPTDWIQKKGKAASEIFDNEYEKWQSLLMLLGWSPYQFEGKDKDAAFGDINFDDIDFDDIDFDDVDFD